MKTDSNCASNDSATKDPATNDLPPFNLADADPDLLIDTNTAAIFLGCSPRYLRKSRVTGELFGKPAPKFIKRGRKVDYTIRELRKCRDQAQEYENTAQYPSTAKGKKET